MRSIHVEKKISGVSKQDLWKILTDVSSYPTYVPFLTKAYLLNPLQVESIWYDRTHILWIPMAFQHKTLTLKEGEEMSFAVKVPFHGYMEQIYRIQQDGEIIQIVSGAKFHLGNPIVHALVSPILERRLKKMMEGMMENIHKTVPMPK